VTAPDGDGRPPRRGHAFGLDLHTSVDVPELPVGSAAEASPLATLVEDADRALRRRWPEDESERVLGRVRMDGRTIMVVDEHPELGFHIWAPYYGRHLVSPDGTEIRSALPAIPAWRWERLLFAQVLPLAAALNGRELFHASAVALDGGVLAFVGLSGAGKSSIAAHLVAGGAELVTDDVLALERRPDGILAHPGSGLAGLDKRELSAMGDRGRARLGRALGRADKTYLAVPVVDRALPLRALYFIAEAKSGDVAIAASDSVPERLLGSSFIAYLRRPDLLLEHLDVCTHVADTVPILELSVPPGVPAKAVAADVQAHARSLR
jgi:hypothetical protein